MLVRYQQFFLFRRIVMSSFIMAIAIATSSESVDGIRLRGGSSCANGSCSVAAAPAVEKKAETPVKQEALATCQSGSCGSRNSYSKFHVFRNRCR
jgi:hypothetical protein